jgi:hypothetical protein
MIFPDVTEDSPLPVTHVREPGNAGESGPVHGTVTQIERHGAGVTILTIRVA